MSALQIAMAAGETSGDLLAGAVIRQLSMRLPPDSRYFGIGGAQMRAAGFQARFPSEKLAVRGYVEAARHLPEFLWLRRAFKRTLRFFFFNDTATTEIYTLSLHDALPI